jgi:hypothetical protein
MFYEAEETAIDGILSYQRFTSTGRETGLINEAGLSRLLSQRQRPFAMLTAWRYNRGAEKNQRLNDELLASLNLLHAGPYRVVGYYHYRNEDTGAKELSREESFFVPKPKDMDFETFEARMMQAGKRYGQESVLFYDGSRTYLKDPRNGKLLEVVSRGTKTQVGSGVSKDVLVKGYSRMRKKNRPAGAEQVPFTFEGVEHPSSISSQRYFDAIGLRWIPVEASMQESVRRQSSSDRRADRKARKRRWKKYKGRRRPATAAQRRGYKQIARAMKRGGLAKKISRLRSDVNLPDKLPVIEVETLHPRYYTNLIVAEAAASKGAGVDADDVKEFVKFFMDKSPAYSQTDTGLAALQFESFLTERQMGVLDRLVETVVDRNESTFLAVFHGKITEEEMKQLRQAVSEFVEFDVLVKAGAKNYDDDRVSDLTVLECKPVKGFDFPNPFKQDKEDEDQPRVNEDLHPRTREDYQRVIDEGGLPVIHFQTLFPGAALSTPDSGPLLEAQDPYGTLWVSTDGQRFVPKLERRSDPKIVSEANVLKTSARGAYFISPSGKFVPTTATHIATVISNPEKFGMTREQIDAVFAKYREKPGSEGNAREELLKQLISKGWIRVRKYNRPEKWSVNVSRLNKRTKDRIYRWAKALLKADKNAKYEEVHIVALDDPATGVVRMDVEDISKDALYAESEIDLPRMPVQVMLVEHLDDAGVFTVSDGETLEHVFQYKDVEAHVTVREGGDYVLYLGNEWAGEFPSVDHAVQVAKLAIQEALDGGDVDALLVELQGAGMDFRRGRRLMKRTGKNKRDKRRLE